MDEDNMPMAFPDGHVYSREVQSLNIPVPMMTDLYFLSQVLEEMALKSGGIVTCPRTGKSCPFTQLRKVFIS